MLNTYHRILPKLRDERNAKMIISNGGGDFIEVAGDKLSEEEAKQIVKIFKNAA